MKVIPVLLIIVFPFLFQRYCPTNKYFRIADNGKPAYSLQNPENKIQGGHEVIAFISYTQIIPDFFRETL